MEIIVDSLIQAEPGDVLKSAIKLLHLLGIVLGVGGATILDLIALRFLLAEQIKGEHVHLVEFVSKIVSAGLAILWVSGILYLSHYAIFDPDKLGNEKVWAKIGIVVVLTINGYFIHHRVLPLVRRQVGAALFAGIGDGERSLLLIFGAVSATSWYVPLVLGAMPHFNFVVPVAAILSTYAAILLMAIASTQCLARAFLPEQKDPTLEHAQAILTERVATLLASRSARATMRT